MALLEDVVIFCKKELNIPDEILVSLETEDLSEDNVKGWTTDSADYTKTVILMKMKLTKKRKCYIKNI